MWCLSARSEPDWSLSPISVVFVFVERNILGTYVKQMHGFLYLFHGTEDVFINRMFFMVQWSCRLVFIQGLQPWPGCFLSSSQNPLS